MINIATYALRFQVLKLMVGERFCRNFKKLLLFFAGFRKNWLRLDFPNGIAYVEKGKARVYTS